MDGDGDAVTKDTPFLLGSVAKTMAATIVMDLERDGRLRLDDHVSEHIDFLPDGDPTIEQLLTHTAGFTSADGIDVADRQDERRGAIRRAVESLEHSGTVGEYEYTSADYLVLGAIVEDVTGRPYAKVLKSRLFDPLGMDHSGARPGTAGHSPGHRMWWGKPIGYDTTFDESGTPYASVASSLTDLETYAIAQLRGTAIPPSVRTRMQQPRVRSSKDHYGLGWSVTQVRGEKVIHHTGATPGYFSHVYLIPGQETAVLILANAYSEARAPSLAAGAEDIWSILDGQNREPAEGSALLLSTPWILSGLAGIGLALAMLSIRRPAPRRLRFASATASLVVVLALSQLPALFGYEFRALRIWLPDAAWSLIAALVLWSLATALWLLPSRGPNHRHGAP